MSNKQNAFSGATAALGIDALFADTGVQYSLIPLDMIEVKEQIREMFEDEENTLEDLASSIKARGVLQPILLRPTAAGYELVAGERRFRAASMAGLEQIPAFIRELTDEEADDAQLAENIHRKNLTQIEEAKKIQRDLDRLGSTDAVLEKHQKSRPWLSKMLGLLQLPEQTRRLVTENVSADVEVINTVKTIERIDPEKARALVDDLKATRGKANARDKAAAVKEDVKPGKKSQAMKKDPTGGIVASPKDRGQEEPSDVETYVTNQAADADEPRPVVFSPARVLNDAYTAIFEKRKSPKSIFDGMTPENREHVEGWLRTFYDAGQQAKDVGYAVIHGFRAGQFSSDGENAFALVAFLHGADSEAKFSLLNILGSVKE